MNTKEFNTVDKMIAHERLKKVKDFVEDGDTILDFGCGVNSFLLESVAKKIRMGVGVDYDAINRNWEKNISYVKHKFEDNLPFTNETFDKIFLLAVLEHIEIDKVNKLFLEFKRVLKKDGLVILTTPTLMNKMPLEFLANLGVISAGEVYDHKKYYQKKDVAKLAKSSGLELVSYDIFQLGLNSRAVLKKNN